MAKEGASGFKKLLIFFGVIAFLAMAVVGIIMLVPKDTYSMTSALQENQETFFLAQAEEEQKYDNFTNLIKASEYSYYSDEIDDVKTLSKDMAKILQIYSNEMFFAENNKTLSNKSKNIKILISKVNSLQQSLDATLDKTQYWTPQSIPYLKTAWIDLRNDYIELIENYYNLYTTLEICYEKCFDESFTHNKATYCVLKTYNDFLVSLLNDFKTIKSKDAKLVSGQGEYGYHSKEKVAIFHSFVDKAFKESKTYSLSASVRAKYAKIEGFFSLYKKTNFKELVNSIVDGEGITKEYPEVQDEEGLLTYAKEFLDRRESV
jgi:hypothetical protein